MSERAVFDAREVHCTSCGKRLTKALGEIGGVDRAEVNLAQERVRPEFAAACKYSTEPVDPGAVGRLSRG